MFEKKLKADLKRIFDLKKVTLDLPGEDVEQDTLFIDVESSMNRIKSGKETAIVRGKASLYGRSDKIAFGFFSKRIQNAGKDETKDFFFADFETSTSVYRNLVQRSFNFVYFYSGQFDPDSGTITDIEFKEPTA